MAFLRLFAMMLIPQTVVYVCVYLYLRQVKRETLERDYNASATDRERTAFVEAGVRAYGARIWRWLAVTVYLGPWGALAVTIYLSNFK
ncbi:hypothetical protein [Pseudoruegeria sp. SK021]|uniref:hypothetical protein n=1 Tax=Pseudoruegeria sp. SK021 TaxID=1933035 RepID=UPI000A2224E4|nr:hypothetical protein [Pseudoruegeria sp. SK021]OSP56185.1 hypothetical protein BV911_04445 [Pseudoruegeria sp. SK021]